MRDAVESAGAPGRSDPELALAPIEPGQYGGGLGQALTSLPPITVEVVGPFGATGLPRCLGQLALFVDAAVGRTPMNISRRNNCEPITTPHISIRIAKNLEHIAQGRKPLHFGLGRNVLR